MRISCFHFLAITLAVKVLLPVTSNYLLAEQTPPTQSAPIAEPAPGQGDEEAGNPLADPKAIVILGKARFTVLTPQLIRMEWSANGKFEDRASLVFINRRLPVPPFTHQLTDNGHKLIIKTDALTLTYLLVGDGRFTADDLSIAFTVDGKPVTWHPGASTPATSRAPHARSMARSATRRGSPSARD